MCVRAQSAQRKITTPAATSPLPSLCAHTDCGCQIAVPAIIGGVGLEKKIPQKRLLCAQ